MPQKQNRCVFQCLAVLAYFFSAEPAQFHTRMSVLTSGVISETPLEVAAQMSIQKIAPRSCQSSTETARIEAALVKSHAKSLQCEPRLKPTSSFFCQKTNNSLCVHERIG